MAFLATFSDANRHLDSNKITFADAADAVPEAEQADAIVRASLADVFPDNVNEWSEDGDPEETPDLVRLIASLIMASKKYAKRYSEEATEENEYAKALWAEAMMLIAGLRDGNLELSDTDYGDVTQWGRSSFWPNDTTVFEGTSEPLRAFKVEQRF